ncbi:hypothetical protein WP12_17580 [Sphingomonas sp. SRS2]|nr:hypothetical protein WP12_17580 [Sphingomonas sp. SRS2]
MRRTQEQLQGARDREAVLRNELQHRVRNMLAIIRSIFSRSMTSGGSIDDIADHFHGRLDTIARYQSFHSIDPMRSVDVEQIVRDELHSFQFGDDPVITIEGHEAHINQDVAQLTALAVHELVTNSLKFGALSGGDARVRLLIRWTVAGNALTLEWLESGVAIIGAAPLRRGFGREFIEQALPYQIGATTSFDLRPGGLTCIITIPLDVVAAPVI